MNMRNDEKTETLINFDPLIECSWLPSGEIRLSEYEEIITYFVQKQISERLDA